MRSRPSANYGSTLGRFDPFPLAPRIAERSTTALASRPQPVCATPGGTCLIEGIVYVVEGQTALDAPDKWNLTGNAIGS